MAESKSEPASEKWLPALVGSTLAAPAAPAPAPADTTEEEEEERVYQVDTDAGALLLKSPTRGMRWALPSQALPLLAHAPTEPPTAAIAALSISSSPSPAPAVTTTLPPTPDHGRRTIIKPQPQSEPDSILSPGTLLLDAPAVAAVAGDAWLDKACHRCLRVPSGAGGKIFECEACRTTHWCSHACFELEVANGGIHALLCPRLRRIRQRSLLKGLKREGAAWAVDGETVRLALQVIGAAAVAFLQRVARHMGKEGAGGLPPGMQTEMDEVMALVSHRDSAPPELWKEALAIAEGLRAPEAKKEQEEDAMVVRSDALFRSYPPEELAELLLRVRLNSHPFAISAPATGAQQVKVLGLFPRLAGAVNHACRPTAALSFRLQDVEGGDDERGHWSRGLRAQLRALEPLASGEEVTYSYLSQVHAPRRDRRQQLLQSFYFHCRCGRCQEEKTPDFIHGDEAIACPRCGGAATRATADAARCLGPSCSPTSTTLPAHAFDQAVTEGHALLARAREAAVLTLTGKGGGESSRVRRCAEEVLAWLVGSGSGARRLGEGHRLRSETAALLLRLAQQTPQAQPFAPLATAAAAGVMDGYFRAKRLTTHPERAVMLAARAKALVSLASASSAGSATPPMVQRVLYAQAIAAARGALAVYEVAFGPGHVETEGARGLVGRVEREARAVGMGVGF